MGVCAFGGVSLEVYQVMLEAVEQQHRAFGRPPKLALADQVLLYLMYWREYRTLAAIGFSYGVSETTTWRIVRRVEDALLASGRFTLPGKKALHSPQLKNALVLLDATEVPVQRPRATSPCNVPVQRPRATSPCNVPVQRPRATSPCNVPVVKKTSALLLRQEAAPHAQSSSRRRKEQQTHCGHRLCCGSCP